jgi:hypothetical protein
MEETMIDFFVNVWKSSVANKITLIAGALILLVAIVGLIYGVATG